ncbi:MAG: GtrA family protein [Proteobacteria bacterium]|nr:GtrA family protein [Pseudomonadota bacterium]MBU1737144.1 GtrA family protein [Pseudomonadota bacterium]
MIHLNESLLQFIKYAICGGLATAAHIIFFHLAAWKIFPALRENDYAVEFLDLPVADIDDPTRARNSMSSNVLAFVFSNMVAYILNIFWVFERGRHPIVIEIALFYLVSGISTLIGTLLMGFLIKRFGLLTSHAFATNIVSAVLINYVVRKYFIFYG